MTFKRDINHTSIAIDFSKILGMPAKPLNRMGDNLSPVYLTIAEYSSVQRLTVISDSDDDRAVFQC